MRGFFAALTFIAVYINGTCLAVAAKVDPVSPMGWAPVFAAFLSALVVWDETRDLVRP